MTVLLVFGSEFGVCSSPMKSPVTLLAPLFALALIIAACGDGDDDTATDETTTTEATAEAVEEETTTTAAASSDDLASLFDNPEFQQLITDAGVTLTDEQTACLAENLDDDLLTSLAGLLAEDLTAVDPQAVTVFLDILVTCEIPLTAFADSL